MTKKLTILVSACNEAGHLNACAGETLALKKRGHRVIFVLPEAWRGKLAALGFEEFIYQPSVAFSPDQHPGEHTAKILNEFNLLGNYSPKEKLVSLRNLFDSVHHLTEISDNDGAVKKAIEQFKPDAIIVDAHSLAPSIFYSGIPWIRSCR